MAAQQDFENVFQRLKAILKKYEASLHVDADLPDKYYLSTHQIPAEVGAQQNPMFFGGVQIRKNYVSFYLMPAYTHPELVGGISEKLQKRRQGKSCFNFKTADEALLGELAECVQRGFEAYQRARYIG
jgi:hypothetical protein